MTPPFTNALQAVVPVVALLGSALAGGAWRDALRTACLAAFLVSLLLLLLGRSRRGAVLVECGRQPAHAYHLLAAVLFALTALLVLALGKGGGQDPVLYAALSGVFFLRSLARLQVTEHGIWHHWGLWRWPAIESHQWQEGPPPVLVLQVRTKGVTMRSVLLPVADGQREVVAALLEQHGVRRVL